MKRVMRRAAFSIFIAVSIPAQASCVDWGLYAAHIAELRNGGLRNDAAQQMMWGDALEGAVNGASNETRFAGFDPDHAKSIIASVYSSHHDPTYYGVVTTDLCHRSGWDK